MSQKFVIGLVGEMGSGKETFGKTLQEEIRGLRVERFTFSALLRQTLELWDISATRENLQKLARVMDDGFGTGALTRAGRCRIDRLEADVIVVDGVRWESDYDFIRSLPNHLLVFITADPEIRLERLRARREKAGEGDMTREQFAEASAARNEVSIPSIGARADRRIENNGTLEDFKVKIKALAREIEMR